VWVYINAYEQMKDKQDLELLSKLAASIAETAGVGCSAVQNMEKASQNGMSFFQKNIRWKRLN